MESRGWTRLGLLLALATGACSRVQPQASACPTDKLAFTQATGCLNDGSVELCLPKEPQAVERIRALAPELTGPLGSRGRAGCDLSVEELYLLPTRPGAECVEPHGALTDEAWARMCRIAADPAVSRIVPTWFE